MIKLGSWDAIRLEHMKALVAAARAWRDPDFGPRKRATEKTMAADNRFTKEAIVFAVNQQVRQVNMAVLRRWVDVPTRLGMAPVVAVLEAGNVPFAGFQDYLAVTAAGNWFRGAVSSKSPYLLKAFAKEVEERGGPEATFVAYDALLTGVDAIIGSGSDETVERLEKDCADAGIVPANRLLRGNRFSVAVLDGNEHEEQRLRLAEDALLHEGFGCRNVAVVFAPEGLDVDPYLQALSVFRGTFPAHAKTRGALRMPQAFLKAVDAPHAYGDGFEFLVSRGEAEIQQPGHIRWAPYQTISTVNDWLSENCNSIQIVCARSAVRKLLTAGVTTVPFGQSQRPEIDWRADGKDVIRFLGSISP